MTDYKFKELPEEFKTTGDVGNGPMKFVIQESMVYETFMLAPLYLSTGEYIASLCWVGDSQEGTGTINQPCIITHEDDTKYLSYDGRINYAGGSDSVIIPNVGATYPITQRKEYYFNRDNPLIPDKKYSLLSNNASIRLNNISIFNQDYSKGVMLDLRASMEGVFSTNPKEGWIVILAAVDEIN